MTSRRRLTATGPRTPLQAAYADGRLTRDESCDRIAQVLQARTHGQLVSALAGISRDRRDILGAPLRTGPAAVTVASASPRPPRYPGTVSGAAASAGGFLAACGAAVTAGAYISVPVRIVFSHSDLYGQGIPYPAGGAYAAPDLAGCHALGAPRDLVVAARRCRGAGRHVRAGGAILAFTGSEPKFGVRRGRPAAGPGSAGDRCRSATAACYGLPEGRRKDKLRAGGWCVRPTAAALN